MMQKWQRVLTLPLLTTQRLAMSTPSFQMRHFSLKKEEEARTFKKQERIWMDRHVNDEYVKKARMQAYRSRASFKLLEIDDKQKIFRKGMRVIDVGAAPGGWSQVIAERVNSVAGAESVVAVDLLEMMPVDGVHFVQGNIEDEDVQEKISEKLGFEKADVICSDAVPDFVGDRFVDHMNAVYLNKEVLKLCSLQLRDGGSLIMKIISGPGEEKLHKYALDGFEKVHRIKPNASRQESKEIYFYCTNFGGTLSEQMKQMTETFEKLNDKDIWEKNPLQA